MTFSQCVSARGIKRESIQRDKQNQIRRTAASNSTQNTVGTNMTHTRALWLPCPCPPIKISKINDFCEQKNKVGVCFAERYHRYHRRTNGKENRSGAARGSAANVGTGGPNKGSHVVARVSFGKGSRGDGGRRSRGGGVKVIFTTGFPSFLRAALGETTTLQTWEEKENIGLKLPKK